MKLIIDIPEEMYASIRNGMRYTDDVRYIMDLIENGTPLTESDDCVSREAVIKLVKKGEYDITGETDNEMFLEEVNKLPSVQPKITTQIDKSNFSKEQYNADLQCAYDCGKASVQPKQDKGDKE